jgi:hypothetical protein
VAVPGPSGKKAGAHDKQPGAVIGVMAPGTQEDQVLGMQEFDGLFVEFHVLAK